TVWNAGGNVVQDGTGLLGNGGWQGIPGSAGQGVSIVKSIANPNQYYVFVLSSAEESGGSNLSYLRYSIVDMSANNGDGSVLPTQKNIILDSNTSEKMTVTTVLGCSYWLLIHSRNSAEYHAFKIDANGLDTNPVISTGIWTGDMGGGQLKFSPDGTLVACGTTLVNTPLELASFDKATGQLSNFYSLPTPQGNLITYGVCFSPDNNFLYQGTWSYIYQYDLSLLPDVNAMSNAVYTYPQIFSCSSMRLAPDGKIYIATFSQPYLACIENPNVYGAGSNLNITALAQPAWADFGGNTFGHGLGAEVVVVSGGDTLAHQVFDTMLCDQEVSLTASAGFGAYIWDDGSTGQTKTVTESGTYYVYLLETCGAKVDSFHVTLTTITADLGQDTFIC